MCPRFTHNPGRSGCGHVSFVCFLSMFCFVLFCFVLYYQSVQIVYNYNSAAFGTTVPCNSRISAIFSRKHFLIIIAASSGHNSIRYHFSSQKKYPAGMIIKFHSNMSFSGVTSMSSWWANPLAPWLGDTQACTLQPSKSWVVPKITPPGASIPL